MRTIVWDVDDVLNELMRDWFERAWVPTHPACTIRYEGLSQNPPHELLGIDRDVYLSSLDSFRLSDEFSRMTPNGTLISWFKRSGHRFRHIALTATPIRCAPHSAAWVLRHFGDWMRTFAFVPSMRNSDPAFDYDRTKEDYLQWWGKADYFIDDNPGHVEAAQKLGVRAFLAPRPWNRAEGTLADILASLDGSL